MIVYIEKQANVDALFIVTKEAFLKCFSIEDFENRDRLDTEDAYLKDWFYTKEEKTYFIPPPVNFVGGRTQFISGRHRTDVLFRHLDEIVMAFNMKSSSGFVKECGFLPYDEHSPFMLPDLPVKLTL